MKRARLGDVYYIKVPNGNKLYQWAYSIPRKGDFIRVFDGLYSSIPDNLLDIVAGSHSYIISFDTKRAYRVGLAQLLGNFPVPEEYPFPDFKLALHPGGSKRIGAINVQPTSSTQDRGRFSVLVEIVVFSQEKSLKYDANNTQDTEPSPFLEPSPVL